MFASVAAAVALALLPSTQAMWIITHHRGGLLHDRLDPIVSPGTVASHVHAVAGAYNFAPDVTPEVLKQSKCSTSPVQADMSNYWVPQLYNKNDNNTFSAIPVAFINTYYLNRDGPNTKKISAFPDGLRMLAGSPYRTTYNASSHEDAAISYVCLDYSGKLSSGPDPTFPKHTCPDGLRAQIVFPSCWDGVNLDSADHKSHMAYPIQAPDSGDCPATHPHKLITLFYEFVFDVNQFSGAGADKWTWATGTSEYGFHGDFLNGWDTNVLQAAVDQCTGLLFGDLKSCPPFVATLDDDKAGKCTKDSVVEEEMGFNKPLSRLPGCNPYPNQGGPAKCINMAVPAIKGISAGTPAGSSSVPSSSTASASATSSSVPATTDASTSSTVVAGSSSSSSAQATASQASSSTASPATSTSSTVSSSVPTSMSLPASGVLVAVPTSQKHNIGATHSLPTAHPSKPTGSCKHPIPGTSPAKHKRAVHAHVRRHLNRLSY